MQAMPSKNLAVSTVPLHMPYIQRRPTLEVSGKPFKLVSDYMPAGDQPEAIRQLIGGVSNGERDQVLLGVTGSGKTFTMANVIASQGRPALVMAPNKTLAAQLWSEMKGFFPENAVEYFVSYYDYYQPEAYVPRTDTYIEKDSSINEQIDRMRHSATRALMERDDVIIVASVSCIYGIGPLENYQKMTFRLHKGQKISRTDLLRRFVEQQYKRNDNAFQRGTFRVRGDTIDLFPAHYEDKAWRFEMFGDEIESITEFDPLTGDKTISLGDIIVYANSHYVTPKPTMQKAIDQIKTDLKQRLDEFNRAGRLLEAQRLEQRTLFDIEMLETTGACAGIENYSRYLTGRKPGEPPPTLFEYFPENSLLICDESHVTVPQIGGMFRGDFNRKSVLAEFGFRLPSAIDNRPLKFEEWETLRPQTTFVSATPGPWEMERTQGIFIEQVIRPTGLIDPTVIIRPVEKQVDDLIAECKDCAKKSQRVLVTVLTKRMAEDLVEYLHEAGIRCRYLHSDIDTLERIEIIRDLRLGAFDVLVGINLLREGLDIPNARWWRSSMPTRKASCVRRPRWCRRSVAPPATSRAGSSSMRQDHRFDQVCDERDRSAARQAGRLQRGARHHAGLDQEEHRRDPAIDRRARPLHSRHRRVGRRAPGRPQPAQPHRRAREAHARCRRQPRVRGSARIRDEIHRLEANELELPGQAASANVGIHLGKMQHSRVFRGVRTGSGGRGKQARRSGR